jgi:hypothetical protein
MSNSPPRYLNDLPGFAGDLRSRLFRFQIEAANYFHVSRPTITRYENNAYLPPLGYITALTRLLVERQEEPVAATYRQQLLEDINRMIRVHYPQELPFREWPELVAVADAYLAEQQAKGQAREAAQTPLNVQLSSTKLSLPGQITLNIHLEPSRPEARLEAGSGPVAIPAPEQTWDLSRKLPIPTYSELFGAKPYLEKLLGYLQDPSSHAIISIQGIGGIGKTALADCGVRCFLQRSSTVHDLIWISAKQEYLTEAGIRRNQTQINLESLFDEFGKKLELLGVLRLPLEQKIDRLARVLRSQPYLVIIDNLETVEDFQEIVPWLERLAMPTKFLLTTREYLPALTTVALIRLGELDREASLALSQHVAQAKEVDCKAAEQVYGLVGGNPLAIILTVSQMQYLPAKTIFQNIKLGTAEEIYQYVYWKTWTALNDEARQVLFAIQRAGDQANWEWLALTMTLPELSLQDALQHLIDLSLVQPQRPLEGPPYYTIHRLTSTFLRTEVLGWK